MKITDFRRPLSFPIPIVLVQSVDALPFLEHVVQHKNDKIGQNAIFGIGMKNTSIPGTMVVFAYIMIIVNFSLSLTFFMDKYCSIVTLTIFF